MFGIFTTIASGISALFSGVGAAVCNLASGLLTALPKALEIGKVILQSVAEVIVKVAQILAISPENENVEELGVKAMQEDTRPRMEDESMEDYLDYLRNEVAIDKEKMLNMSEEDKIKCQAIGVGMLSEAIVEKKGIEISPTFLIAMNNMRMTGDLLSSYIEEFSKHEISSMDALIDYLKGNLNEDDTKSMYSLIKDVETRNTPDVSLLELQDKIENYKGAISEIED